MAKYAEKLPVMKAEAIASPVAQAAGPEALAAVASARMRCSGCGAKVCPKPRVHATMWCILQPALQPEPEQQCDCR